MGGLGHMAVKIAHALGAEVTVISQTLSKQEDGLKLGADHYYASSDPETFTQLRSSFDLIINTISADMDIDAYARTLRLWDQRFNEVWPHLKPRGFDEAFRIFANHVTAKYGAEPGFITMNLPRLLDALDRVGVENPIVCANINKIGFRMCGGIDAYVDALRHRDCRAIAMSVFAIAGYVQQHSQQPEMVPESEVAATL
jgi:hypothetical protein